MPRPIESTDIERKVLNEVDMSETGLQTFKKSYTLKDLFMDLAYLLGKDAPRPLTEEEEKKIV